MQDDIIPRLKAMEPAARAALLAQLKPQERKAMELRYGWGGKDPLSKKKVGEAMGLEKARVEGIITSTLEKLRAMLPCE